MIHRDNWQHTRRYLRFMEEVKQRDPKTLSNVRAHLRHFLEWADSDPLEKWAARRPTYPRYLLTARNAGETGKPLDYQTTKKSCAIVRGFLAWLRQDVPAAARHLPPSFVDSLIPVRRAGDDQAKARHIYTLEDVRALVALPYTSLAEERSRAAIAFLFLSGMRASAFCTLRIQCVDIAARKIKQWPSLGVRTKGNKTGTTFLLDIPDLLEIVAAWDAKVRAALPPDAYWYAPVKFGRLTLEDELSPRVLTERQSVNANNRASQLRTYIQHACEVAGIAPLGLHKFRHGHATYALKQAVTVADLKAVSQNLMHSNLQTTDSIYSVLTADDVEERIAGLGRAPRETPAPAQALEDALLERLTARLLARLEKE